MGIACVINIGLDLFTVCVLHWDVAGVALSAITAQAVSVILSFVVINSVANQLGPDPNAWAGIAFGYYVDNKLTTFAMIIPTAFLQSMAVFTAQNVGAGNRERCQNGLRYMLTTALDVGVALALLCEFGGSVMASVFTNDAETIYYAAQYLKGYALDCLICASMLTLLDYF